MSFWTEKALSAASSSSDEIMIQKNKIFSCDDDKYFYIVKTGLLINLDNLDKKQGQYFPAYSFFGSLPFVESKNKIKLTAAVNSVVYRIEVSRILQVFIEDVKLYKAYLNFLKRNSIDLKSAYQSITQLKNRIISVSSSEKGAGKSLFTSLLAKNISASIKTLVIDLSYGGISVFEYFGLQIISPAAEKENSESKIDLSLRMTAVNDKLSILNMTNTSKVNLNLDVLSHLLFKLLHQYDCILMDVDSSHEDLQEKAFSLSDAVIVLIGKKNENNFSIIDRFCSRGQDVYLINNNYLSKRSVVEGFYQFDSINVKNDNFTEISDEHVQMNVFKALKNEVYRKKSALVLNTSNLSTAYYSGMFRYFFHEKIFFDFIAADFLGAVNAMFFLNSENYAQYVKLVKDFFRMEKLKVLSEVTYPENHVYSIEKFEKYFSGIFSSKRMEFNNSKLISYFKSERAENSIKTCGLLSKIASANVSINPFFQKTDNFGSMLSLNRDSINIDRWIDYFQIEGITAAQINTPEFPPSSDILDGIFKSNRVFESNFMENEVLGLNVETISGNINEIIDFSEKSWNENFKKNSVKNN